VALGSLGEAATLQFEEKVQILETLRRALGKGVPLIAGIAGLSTAECVALAKRSQAAGCDGLMALPPYVYRGDWRETEAHYSAVISATPLSCMLYNNPIAYGTDVSARPDGDPGPVPKPARGERVEWRRPPGHRDRGAPGGPPGNLLRHGRYDPGERSAGSRGWIAGLVNALPLESVQVFEWARDGKWAEARRLYEWFLPLLRLDTVPKFVQLIKLVQQEVGRGNARVRPPRLELDGAELRQTQDLIRERLASKPR
jgi:4-hydroxy-tetrahydrodipicolinate synthase